MAELINSSNYQDFNIKNLVTPEGITKLNNILRQLSHNIPSDNEAFKIYQGIGSPEGSVTAVTGSLYMRKDGGSSSSLYVKESGNGNTGWIAK